MAELFKVVTERLIEFVNKAKHGSEKAFMVLIDTVKVQLYKTALIRLRNEQDALDAVQETVMKAFSGINNLREERFFKSWIIRILINECNDMLRYKSKVIPMESNLVSTGTDSFSEAYEAIDMQSTLQSLDIIYREVIDLRYNHDLKFEDIARILDIPVGTVKSRLNRAHSLLRNQLSTGHCEKEVL